MYEYLKVAKDEDDEPIHIPTEEDGTLLLSTLRSQYPGTCGLKYRHPETDSIRGIRLTGGRLHPPRGEDGWGTRVYLYVFRKENKRKRDDALENSTAKVTKIQTDCTDATVTNICIPFDDNVLGDLKSLITALQSPLLDTIPVDRVITDGSGLTETSVFRKACNGEEASFLVTRFQAFEDKCKELAIGISEAAVSHCITEITGLMWRKMAICMKLRPLLSYYYNKADQSGARTDGGRPDETDYLNDFLVCKSEHKSIKLQDAVQELTNKLVSYNHVEYGVKIVHLPVIAAAGMFVEFAVIDVRTVRYQPVIRYCLQEKSDRAKCFVTAINFYRLIHTMSDYIPENPTPLFLKGIKNISFVGSQFVRKKLTDTATCPDQLYELLKKATVPHAVKVEKMPRYLKVTPIGVKTTPEGYELNLEDVRNAVKCVLRCLTFIHEKGFVHRDIRWANLIRLFDSRPDGTIVGYKFLVIDFEFAAADGDVMTIENYIFRDVVAYNEKYFKHHDLILIGKMIRKWARSKPVQLDDDTLSFIQAVQQNVGSVEAGDALHHPWLLKD